MTTRSSPLFLAMIVPVLLIGLYFTLPLPSGQNQSSESEELSSLYQSLGEVPDFEFISSKKKPIKFSDFNGNLRVVSFFFTSCPSICPVIQSGILKAKSHFNSDDQVTFLSITVDPENDTPTAMEEFADKLGISDRDNWFFLRGEEKYTEEVMDHVFKVGSGQLPDQHSTRVIVIDKAGDVRSMIQGMDPDFSDQLLKVLNYLKTS